MTTGHALKRGTLRFFIMILSNFVAIDFETMTGALTSACAVGLVKVREGVIIEEYYTLIHPIPDTFERTNTGINGITPAMVESVPTFEDIFPLLLRFIDDNTLVCHNAGTDINVLRCCMEHYNLTGINLDRCIDTFTLYGVGLDKACAEKGIPFINHHNALADAEACARIYLASEQHVTTALATGSFEGAMKHKAARKIDRQVLKPIDVDAVANKETPFFSRRVVITGTFEAYPLRNDLCLLLQSLGADLNTSISKRTDIVVVGQEAGPAKLAKIATLIEAGCDIRVIYEAELVEILAGISLDKG